MNSVARPRGCGHHGAGLRASMAPKPGFLETIRSVTQETRSGPHLDEVVTGFRYGLQGAGLLRRHTDLASFGKAISGGVPLGILAGRKDIMYRMSAQVPPEDVYPQRDLAWHAPGQRGAMAVLDVLEQPGLPQALSDGRAHALRDPGSDHEHEVPMTAFGIGPVLEIAFTDGPIVSPSQDLLKVEPQIIKQM